MALRYGFKSEAERIAQAVRSDLKLALSDRLNCLTLAEQLGIPVVALGDLVRDGANPESIDRLMHRDAGFSALTICLGSRRLIVYNPTHAPTRRASSLAHELSHVILEHPSVPAIGAGGCRRWDQELEDEADYLAATMLVPRGGALAWLRHGGAVELGPEHFGVSVKLFQWRVNQTGVMRQLNARRSWR